MAIREDGKIRIHHCMERVIDTYKDNYYKRGGKGEGKTEDNDFWMMYAIHLVGKLVAKIMFQKRRKYKQMYKFDETELFHIATISLHKAMLRFEVKKSALIYFPTYLAAYIDADFKSIAREESKYVPLDYSEYEARANSLRKAEHVKEVILQQISIREALDKLETEGRITRDNRTLFELHYFEGYALIDLSQTSIGGTQGSVKARIHRVRERLIAEIRCDEVD